LWSTPLIVHTFFNKDIIMKKKPTKAALVNNISKDLMAGVFGSKVEKKKPTKDKRIRHMVGSDERFEPISTPNFKNDPKWVGVSKCADLFFTEKSLLQLSLAVIDVAHEHIDIESPYAILAVDEMTSRLGSEKAGQGILEYHTRLADRGENVMENRLIAKAIEAVLEGMIFIS
jgi:hypothetical protein